MDPLVALDRALKRGRRAALVTVTGLDGSAPSRLGLSLAVTENGTTFGTLGCDGFDRAGTADALAAIERGEFRTGRYAWDETSHIEVAVRPYGPGDQIRVGDAAGPEILVVGAGPVARALVSLAKPLGFRVRVVPGPFEHDPHEFEGADEVHEARNAAGLRAIAIGPSTYVVICGHDEEFSQPALRTLLPSEAPFLGMMGSRRHTGHLVADLRAAGFSDAQLARIHSPVGLDLRAETPEEIALSALAQIVALRRGGGADPLDRTGPA